MPATSTVAATWACCVVGSDYRVTPDMIIGAIGAVRLGEGEFHCARLQGRWQRLDGGAVSVGAYPREHLPRSARRLGQLLQRHGASVPPQAPSTRARWLVKGTLAGNWLLRCLAHHAVGGTRLREGKRRTPSPTRLAHSLPGQDVSLGRLQFGTGSRLPLRAHGRHLHHGGVMPARGPVRKPRSRAGRRSGSRGTRTRRRDSRRRRRRRRQQKAEDDGRGAVEAGARHRARPGTARYMSTRSTESCVRLIVITVVGGCVGKNEAADGVLDGHRRDAELGGEDRADGGRVGDGRGGERPRSMQPASIAICNTRQARNPECPLRSRPENEEARQHRRRGRTSAARSARRRGAGNAGRSPARSPRSCR